MCEPNHSIVQYPDQDDGGNPTERTLDLLPKKEGWVSWMKKKIKNWFHFSKLGFGHSEATARLSLIGAYHFPVDTKYEAQWWIRKVQRDGAYYGQAYDSEIALDCATEYAKLSSIGNLTLLRQFLEVSMRKSTRPESYV